MHRYLRRARFLPAVLAALLTAATAVPLLVASSRPEPVAARGAATHRGGTLRVADLATAYNADVAEALDPSNGHGDWKILSLTNDGLVAYQRGGGPGAYRVVPDLASALPTLRDGGRTYVFLLRRGMRYSTGRGVSPADIRRGIERTLVNGGNELPNAYLTGIVGARACVARPTRCDLTRGIVTASGSSAVTFHLTAPDPDFLYKLALPIADAVPATTPLFNAPLPLPATGPYRIHENLFSVFAAGLILLERNPHFHVWSTAAQPDGFPDRIIDWFGLTPTAELRAVERGAADIARVEADPSLPESVTTALRTHYASQLHYAPLVGLNLLWLSSLGCELARPGYGNGGICNRDIELQLERARRLENTDRRAAAQLRTRIDRQLTLAAPWNTIRFPRSAELLSRRTGNYTYCFLSAGACLDQLWVR